VDNEFRGELAAVHDWVCDRIARTAGRLEGSEEFPHVTYNGRWRSWPADVYAGWDGDSWSHGNWTCGFWMGLLWLALSRTRYFGDLVAPRQRDENTHDLGFIFYPSFALGHGGRETRRARRASGAHPDHPLQPARCVSPGVGPFGSPAGQGFYGYRHVIPIP
jgi:hypothetical protein